MINVSKYTRGVRRYIAGRRFTDIKVGDIIFGGLYDWEVTAVRREGNYFFAKGQWTGYATTIRQPTETVSDLSFCTAYPADFVTYTAMCQQPCLDSDCECVFFEIKD